LAFRVTLSSNSIVVEGLTKVFGKLVAVDHVGFSTRGGEIFGLLGPNGAGKTTTIRMLCTVLSPTEGTARVAGYDIRAQPQKVRERIGVLPEDTGLYDRLTPRDHLAYYGRLHDMPEDLIASRTDLLLERVGLRDRENDKVGGFSKGMRQKLAVIRAFIHDPPVLLLDEPTSGLDVMSAREIREYILSLKTEGKSILLSTHNMTEAEKLCDRISIIDHGRIDATGTLEELRKQTERKTLEDIFVRLVTD